MEKVLLIKGGVLNMEEGQNFDSEVPLDEKTQAEQEARAQPYEQFHNVPEEKLLRIIHHFQDVRKQNISLVANKEEMKTELKARVEFQKEQNSNYYATVMRLEEEKEDLEKEKMEAEIDHDNCKKKLDELKKRLGLHEAQKKKAIVQRILYAKSSHQPNPQQQRATSTDEYGAGPRTSSSSDNPVEVPVPTARPPVKSSKSSQKEPVRRVDVSIQVDLEQEEEDERLLKASLAIANVNSETDNLSLLARIAAIRGSITVTRSPQQQAVPVPAATEAGLGATEGPQ
ncbi:unnamed protein product [Orchesella dallaii]|uniref:Uncharacterized protein n=1 Tax=Orchesella dallaii TaxID=48710 RepID=A0ABP1RMY8_9HEXA